MSKSKTTTKTNGTPTAGPAAVEFITIWQQSDCIDDIVEKTGMKRGAIFARASVYRKRGVALKRFDVHRSRMDWDELKALAESLAGK